MVMTRHPMNKQNFSVGQYFFEHIDSFKYQSVNINYMKTCTIKTILRNVANCECYAMSKIFNSKLLSK